MPDTIWDVFDWDRMVAISKQPTRTGQFALAVVGAADPDGEFLRIAKAVITGKPNDHPSRRERVTQMAAAFGLEDRKLLARYLRSKSIIGPRD